MIVASAPLRISLGGGGTDLPAYAGRFGGFVVSAAIDRRVHVAVGPRFDGRVRVAVELEASVNAGLQAVDRACQVVHPIVREALAMMSIDAGIEITSLSELPPGSGLGGSSAFTVALLAALHAHRGTVPLARQLADEACAIEIDRLREPIGRQDQLVAAFGGVVAMTFAPGGAVDVAPVRAPGGVLEGLADRLLLVHSGATRRARTVLAAQAEALADEGAALEAMHRIAAIGHQVHRLLLADDLDGYGALLHEHWRRKRATTPAMSDPAIDALYDEGRAAGAVGGKLLGAGGGGFFLLQATAGGRETLAHDLASRGRLVLPVRFDARGACILLGTERFAEVRPLDSQGMRDTRRPWRGPPTR